jgi:putative transposase
LTCRWTLDAIERTRERHALHLWAYVLMPEHVHLVVWPTQPDYSISAILTTLKQSVATRALAYVRHSAPGFLRRMEDRQPNGSISHRFWQRGGGFDRNLVEPSALLTTIEYVHANPVRRGLCERPIEWLWSSAAEYEKPGSGPLRIDWESLPSFGAN